LMTHSDLLTGKPEGRMVKTSSKAKPKTRTARTGSVCHGPWHVAVEFIPFESESKREVGYRTWAKLFVRSRLQARPKI